MAKFQLGDQVIILQCNTSDVFRCQNLVGMIIEKSEVLMNSSLKDLYTVRIPGFKNGHNARTGIDTTECLYFKEHEIVCADFTIEL